MFTKEQMAVAVVRAITLGMFIGAENYADVQSAVVVQADGGLTFNEDVSAKVLALSAELLHEMFPDAAVDEFMKSDEIAGG